MKYIFCLLLLCANADLIGRNKIIATNHRLPDSVKAISFLSKVQVQSHYSKKELAAGIIVEKVSLSLEAEKKEKAIVFTFPTEGKIVAQGIDVTSVKGTLEWKHAWQTGEEWSLMISSAGDSTDNFTLYSAYVLVPVLNKWKLMGTCKLTGWSKQIESISNFYTSAKKDTMHAAFGTAWVQRNNGSWKNITDGPEASPAINLISNVDSTDQFLLETKTIQQAIANGMTDAKNVHEGIYYNMMKEGHGNTVSATDTVVIHYKGYLFSDGSIFDQTRDKPATFPLGRLIKGWQIGVPLCKIGGKIKLVIPSAQAYSIRTRSPKIPPNSTLVFEIEVLDAKPFQRP